jgi:peptidoglycan/LPS O-acetylase OafA/YrhL
VTDPGPPPPTWIPSWFAYRFQSSPAGVWRHLLLLDTSLNRVTWSIQVEVAASLLIPLLVWLDTPLKWPGKLALQLLMLAACWRLHAGASHPYAYVLAFLWPFYLGILTARHGAAFWHRLTGPQGRCLTLAGWALLLTAHLIPRATSGLVAEHFAAAVVVSSLIFGPRNWVGRTLDHSFCRFYGRISYDFYLVHYLLMWGCVYLLTPAGAEAWISRHAYVYVLLLTAASTAVATPVAWLLHLGVEQPSIRLSKRLCARWFPATGETGLSAIGSPVAALGTAGN